MEIGGLPSTAAEERIAAPINWSLAEIAVVQDGLIK
jgi:hypothetical protein